MVRWLEANGYDVSYFTDVDTARYGNLILNHQIFMSVGHDEYWSGEQRANVEAARDAGVNLAFFSGNEMLLEDPLGEQHRQLGTPYRTLVCYKESNDNGPIDPLDSSPTWTWTGTWRDPGSGPPADGGRPENAMTGTIYMDDRTSNRPRHPHERARGRREFAVLAEHERREPAAGAGRDAGPVRRRLRGRRGRGQRVPSGRA